MKKFSDYADKAIKRYGLAGYNNLAREIGITKCVMSEFKNEKKTPSEETFLKIVELAGLPKEEALIDLNLWRSKDKPEVQKIWLRLSKMIGCALTFLIFSNFAASSCFANTNTPTQSADISLENIYYATNICLSSGVFSLIILVFSIGYAFCQKLTVAKKTVTAICVMRNGGIRWQRWSAVT